ncbi:hypothetical protein GCM10009840_16030 [Pseudolysinimonas kribbensis]|uniref:Uncharacterized protein n=1 Tax=Pseudolysinimonas kribbensis TaxID=433641 RepID=A0ABQ6K408_9MICO|nr:hypothetical protein [Pseudolysinimonas kribbensis]GMA94039.1 hypothetical protein GCM10025881_08630 [Pseudolysinimonas kribbensis]
MTRRPSDAELAERRARVAASNRRSGATLSITGAVAALLALIALVGGTLLGADFARIATGILLLVAAGCLVLGEQLRRGRWGANPAPPATALPTASIVTRFRLLPMGWHLLWLVLGALVSIALLVLPAIAFSDVDLAAVWIVYGAVGVGAVAGGAVSLLKKAVWRSGASRHPHGGDPARGRVFWRWIGYRWRLDIWAAGIGGFLFGLIPTTLPDVDDSATGAGTALLVMLIAGAVLVAVGIVASTQFWRSGESLGSGESLV